MSFEMTDYIQSVVVQGKVYVGGGYAFKNMKIVMEYNTTSAKWAELPPYQAWRFGMTMIDDQLVLVGGYRYGDQDSKVLGVWGADGREWTHPYPEMPTARSRCSAVVYKEWLVVAGGWSGERVSSVEVMNTDTKQWHIVQSTPTPWNNMKTAIVGDTCYFMGGYTNNYASGDSGTDCVYCVSLPALIIMSGTVTGFKRPNMEGDKWTKDRRFGPTLHQWVFACSGWT